MFCKKCGNVITENLGVKYCNKCKELIKEESVEDLFGTLFKEKV